MAESHSPIDCSVYTAFGQLRQHPANMALAVCYSHRIEDHLQRHAIYLEQTFYALIFRVCRADRATFSILAEIASLRYKSPEMLVDPSRVASLHDELDTLRS